MHIVIKGTHLETTPSLKFYIEKKLGPLAKFVKKIDEAGSAELEFEVSRTTAHHHKGPVFRAEAHLKLPKKIFYMSEENYDIRTAVDMVKNKLRLSLERYKEKELVPTASRRKGRKK